MATDFWYGGSKYWNIANGSPTVANTDQQRAQFSQAQNFAQMLWKGTKTVGFGVKGKFVVAWYCDKAETSNAERSRANIGVYCLVGSVNKCYNDLALKTVNKYRNNHNVGPLKFNNEAAIALQHNLNKQRPGEFLMPEASKRGWQYTGCYQSVFY